MDNDLTPDDTAALDRIMGRYGLDAARVRATASQAAAVVPDQYAEQIRTAQRLGVPVGWVTSNPEQAKADATSRAVADAAGKNAVLARRYTDEEFAKLASDEPGVLTRIGDAVKYLVSAPGAPRGGLAGDAGKIGGAALAGLQNASAGVVGVAQTPFDLAAPLADPLVGTILPVNPLRVTAEGLRDYRRSIEAQAKANMPPTEGNLEAGVFSGVQSLATNLAGLPLAFAGPAGQRAYLTQMALPVAGQGYAQARDQGVAPLPAAVFGASQGTIEAGTEMMGVAPLLKLLKPGSFAKKAGEYLLKEQGGEQLATLFQDMNEWAALPENKDKTLADFVAARPDAAIQTAIATLVGGGGTVAVAKGVSKAADVLQRATAQADQGAAALTEAFSVAAESKLRERSPEQFRALLNEMGEGGEVRFDARNLADVLAQSGMTPEQIDKALPSVREQMATAAATGGEVSIPVGEFIGGTVGTPLEQSLQEHARIGDNELSAAEAKDAVGKAEQYLQQEADRVMQQAAEQERVRSESEQVYQTVLDALNTAGRTGKTANEAYAKLHQAFFTAMAGRVGTTPMELFKQFDLKVRGETPGGENLQQSGGAPADTPVERNLIVAHNLSADNLRHALEIGGLPAPSLAITKADSPIQGFGDITLIGDAKLATPGAKNPVFNADVYSPRFPGVKVKVDAKKVQTALTPLRDAARAAGVYVMEPERVAEDLSRNQVWRAIGDIVHDTGMRYGYATTVAGLQVDVPRKEVAPPAVAKAGGSLVDQSPLRELLPTLDLGEMSPKTQPADLGQKVYAALVNKTLADMGAEANTAEGFDKAMALVNRRIHLFAESTIETGSVEFSPDKVGLMTGRGLYMLYTLTSNTPSAKTAEPAPKARKEVDLSALNAKLDEVIDDEQMRTWVRQQLEPALGEKRIVKEGGRTADYTLDNLVKEMTKKVRDAEGFNYGLGNARSKGATKFKNLKAVQAQRGQVQPKADADAAIKANEERFRQLTDKFAEFYPGEKERYGRKTWEALPEVVGDSYTLGVDRALTENGFVGVPTKLVNELKQFAADLVNLPTEYFETKPQRAVSLDEFKGALVPSSAPADVRAALAELGLPVVEYTKGDEADRARAAQELAGQLDQAHGGVLFQNRTEQGTRGTFSPSTNTITLLQNADLSTFLHESGHFFLEAMSDLAARPDAPAQVREDMDKLLSWFGVKGDETVGGPDAGGELEQAAAQGYEGSDAGEAREWLAAKAKGLDMSTEARMARAKAMGFDTGKTLYHSTLADQTEFAPFGQFMGYTGTSGISVTDNPEMASRYLDRYASHGWVDGKPNQAFQKNVIPVFIKPGNVLERDEPFPMPPGMRLGAPLPANYVPAHKAMGYDTLIRNDAISRKGEVKHSTAKNAIKGKEYVLTDPSQVRSIFAAFDPDNASSGNLLAQGSTPTTPEPVTPKRTPLETWRAMTLEQKRPHHERFAESFEQYLFEGRAPSVELRPVFRRFREFLKRVYTGLKEFLAGRQNTPGGVAGAYGQGGSDFLKGEDGQPLVLYHGTETPGFDEFVPGGTSGSRQTGSTLGLGVYLSTDPKDGDIYAGKAGAVMPLHVRGNLLDLGNLTREQLRSMSDWANENLTPSDKARFEGPRKRVEFDDKNEALDFFKDRKADWSHFDGITDRGKPKALSEGGKFVVDYVDYSTPVKLENAADVETLLGAVGWNSVADFGYDGAIIPKGDGRKWVVMYNPAGNIKSAIGNNGQFDPNDPSILRQSDEKNPLGLTDEVRGVFDRMLASDEAIAEAEQLAGMLPDEDATASAQEKLTARSIRDMKWLDNARSKALKELQAQAKTARQATRLEVRREVMADPVYRAWAFLTTKLGEGERMPDGTRRKSDPNRVDPTQDSLLTAIAKLGGLARDSAANELGVHPDDFKHPSGVFGKPVFRKEGGLQPDAMGERLVEEGYLLLKDDGRYDLRDLKTAIGEELRGAPQYSTAKEYARESERAGEGQDIGALTSGRFDLVGLRDVGATDAEIARLTELRMVAKSGGIHPDLLSDAFRFEGGAELVRSILNSQAPRDVIEGLTDQRMLEEHGDLVDERAMREAANEAVHNAARAKILATELAAQAAMLKAKGSSTATSLARAAREFGESLIARTPVGKLKRAAWQHTQAERRAAKAWGEATAKADTQGAVQAKQDQMLQNAAARAAAEAQEEVGKIKAFFARVAKGSNEKLVKGGRDPDIANAARAVLAAYGMETATTKAAGEYLDAVKTNDPALYAVIEPMVTAATQSAKEIDALTVGELQALRDDVESMWHLAKRSRQMEIDGNLIDIQEAEDEVRADIERVGVPDVTPGELSAPTAKDEAALKLQYAVAVSRRVEQWAIAFGPAVRKYIFGRIKRAADTYRTEATEAQRQLQALYESIAPTMKRGTIAAPELGYTFGKDGSGVGTAELLHALLHTGNESNKRKLLLGREDKVNGGRWATELPDGTLDTSKWDAFLKRMHAEGKITKAHWDFVQGVWDLNEGLKAKAQEAHRDVFGRYFATITAAPVQTPFGEYRGGYVPAKVDPRLVKDNQLRKLAEEENQAMSFAFPGPANGFTKSRVENYTRPLLLDLRTLSQHINSVVLFSNMAPAHNDVKRLLTRKSISSTLSRAQPAAMDGMLIPWLSRSASQTVTTPIMGDGGLSRWFSTIRGRAGMSLMMANVINSAQQIPGVLYALTQVKGEYLRKALGAWVKSPKELGRNVAEASPFMRHRIENEMSAIHDAVNQILLDPNLLQRADATAAKFAYFMQSFLDNIQGPIVWTAAYNEALAGGQAEQAACDHADGVVRMTLGTTLPEDVSRIETGTAPMRFFSQFMGYFNMVANTSGSEMVKLARELGVKKATPRALYIVALTLATAVWIPEVVGILLKGGPDDKDEDGYLDDWLMAVFGASTIKGLTSMVPFGGAVAQVAANSFNDNAADDKLSLSPAVSMLEQAAGAPASIYKAATSEDGNAQKAVKDSFTALALLVNPAFFALGRPAGYMAGMVDDKIAPTSTSDMVRGLVTGVASPASKQ